MPSLYGSALIMSGAPASQLVQMIAPLSLLIITTSYAAVRPYVGAVGALATALLLALAPASQNILGWHGLANVGGFVIVPLVFAGLAGWLAGELDRRGELGLALALVALAAAAPSHLRRDRARRPGGGLARSGDPSRRRAARRPAHRRVRDRDRLLVLLDLRARSATAGGTLPFTAYLNTKIQWDLAVRDISWPLAILGTTALLALIALRRLPRSLWPAAAMLVVVLALTQAYLLHLALYYARMVYFVPLALAPIAGAGIAAATAWLWQREVRRGWPTAVAILAASLAVVGSAAMYRAAHRQADAVKDFYAFANRASLRGLDALTRSSARRARRHRPLLELPDDLAAQHADLPGPRRPRHRPARRAAARTPGRAILAAPTRAHGSPVGSACGTCCWIRPARPLAPRSIRRAACVREPATRDRPAQRPLTATRGVSGRPARGYFAARSGTRIRIAGTTVPGGFVAVELSTRRSPRRTFSGNRERDVLVGAQPNDAQQPILRGTALRFALADHIRLRLGRSNTRTRTRWPAGAVAVPQPTRAVTRSAGRFFSRMLFVLVVIVHEHPNGPVATDAGRLISSSFGSVPESLVFSPPAACQGRPAPPSSARTNSRADRR